MKTLRNSFRLMMASAIIVIHGCSPTTSIYQFDEVQYFKNKNYKKEMPFNMVGGNISAVLFSEKEQDKTNAADIPEDNSIKSTNLLKNNKVKISGALSFKGGDLKIAYSPAKKIMLIVNASSFAQSSVESGFISLPNTRYDTTWTSSVGGQVESTSITHGYDSFLAKKTLTSKQNQMEFAIGYYDSFDKHGIYEAVAGWGLGSAENSYKFAVKWLRTSTDYNTTFMERRNVYSFFLQNNLGYSTKVTEGALCARLTYLRFTGQNFTRDYDTPEYEMENTNLLIEPAFHFGAGWKKFRGFLEYGFVIPLGSTDVDWGGTFRLGTSLQF
ncbi:MAG: hypothetical protein JJE25_08565 [Bacteroidia bacterium]|nr:hypothetical protein [Bacteroidia bacterium]